MLSYYPLLNYILSLAGADPIRAHCMGSGAARQFSGPSPPQALVNCFTALVTVKQQQILKIVCLSTGFQIISHFVILLLFIVIYKAHPEYILVPVYPSFHLH